MQEAGYMDVTFHRAFDAAQNPFEALDTLRELGVQRVLTSGGANSAMEGYDLLGELLEEADEDIVIMPGGGIRSTNIAQLIRLEAKEYHSAALVQGELHSSKSEIQETYLQTWGWLIGKWCMHDDWYLVKTLTQNIDFVKVTMIE